MPPTAASQTPVCRGIAHALRTHQAHKKGIEQRGRGHAPQPKSDACLARREQRRPPGMRAKEIVRAPAGGKSRIKAKAGVGQHKTDGAGGKKRLKKARMGICEP